jgi:hypothetical protein
MVSTYMTYQQYARDLSTVLQRTGAQPQVSRESEYYKANIGSVTSVDEFLDDYRLYSYAMTAYGLEDMIYAEAFMRKVLESDLTDSGSFANKLTDTRFADFASAFRFGTDGTVTSSAIVQSSDQENETTGLYTQRNAVAAAETSTETAYYQNHVDAVASVDDLFGNSRLYRYALTAVGLDPDMVSKTAVRNALTSDLSDASSAANTLAGDFLELAKSFNFGTDGDVKSGYDVQTATQKSTMAALYAAGAEAGVSDARAALNTLYYGNMISEVASIDDLLGDTKLYEYVLTAYGIAPDSVSKTTIRKVLESDVSDTDSFVNRHGDTRMQKLAAAFNFNADGTVASQRLVQTVGDAAGTISLYQSAAGDSTYAQYLARKETAYYQEIISTVTSLDALLDDDRLVAYALAAHGLDADKVSEAELRRILTSDLAADDSYANRLGDARYRDLAAAFNFGVDGTIEREGNEAQSAKAALVTRDRYVRLTMESDAGEESEGVRLALYAERKASSIDSAYDVLADKALLEVVQTALGLADYMSLADIDVQASILEQRLDLSIFKDGEKLGQFLSQFCAMYDIANGDTTTSATVGLFSSSSGVMGFDESLIASLQTTKIGG